MCPGAVFVSCYIVLRNWVVLSPSPDKDGDTWRTQSLSSSTPAVLDTERKESIIASSGNLSGLNGT